MSNLRPLSSTDASVYQRWLHDLRNAANRAGVSMALARHMLENGDVERATEMLDHTDTAWRQCRDLLAGVERVMDERVPRH